MDCPLGPEEAKAELEKACDAFIALAKLVNVATQDSSEAETLETTSKSQLIMLDTMEKKSSEFVIESLLMKVQALAIQQPSQQHIISAQLSNQLGLGEEDSDPVKE